MTQDAGRFSIIKPTKTAVENLPVGKDATDLALPAEFAMIDHDPILLLHSVAASFVEALGVGSLRVIVVRVV